MKKPLTETAEEILTEYWLDHYVSGPSGLCVLCGNSGKVDTRATAISPAGVPAGRITFCICPNGRAMREVSQ